MDTKIIEWQDVGQHGVVNICPMEILAVGHWPEEEDLLMYLGKCAGTAYKPRSFFDDTDKEADIKRALNCIRDGHHSVLEHVQLSILAVVDRGVSHALVRHRHTAFTQSSTIYERYSTSIDIIAVPKEDPLLPGKNNPSCAPVSDTELDAYKYSAVEYMSLIREGVPPSRARDVLHTALATRLVMSTHIGEWVYIVHRRSGKGDTVRMHCFAHMLDTLLRKNYPTIMEEFDKYYMRRPL